MVEDRNELMSHTWPLLRVFCRERQVELVEVDLRWGISEEQSERNETLILCLNEIRACRPFFIGLLGERYGWIPSKKAFTPDLLQEQPWISESARKSITELEIMHGVLNDPNRALHAFFYFRDPVYAGNRGCGFLPEDAESAVRMGSLKERIRAVCAKGKITLHEDYSGPRELGEVVLQDLKAAIGACFPAEEIPDPLTRQALDHEALAEILRRTYVACPAYFDRLDKLALDSSLPLAVIGPSGSGKSALLANWIQHWRQAQPNDFVFQHFIGATHDSTAHWEIAQRLIGEIARWIGDEDDLPRSQPEILNALPHWLAKARAKAERDGVRCIIALDALNQLNDQDHAQHLGWLPEAALTGPLRLVVSTTGGDSLRAVESRKWVCLPIKPLKPGECRSMITGYLALFGKKLDERRLERLALTPTSGSPLYLKILLDELRVTGVYDRLDERLDDYISASNIPMLLRQVLRRYVNDYERDRPGLVGEVLELIRAARRGLTEAEILRLVRPADLPQLPPAVWAPLRAALEEGLVDRGGVLNFAHDFLRTAVKEEFGLSGSMTELRLRLAKEFEAQPVSARSCEELPWLLYHTGQCDRLRLCLLEIDRLIEIEKRDVQELMHYWIWLGEERTMGCAYLAPFRAWCQVVRNEEALAYGASHVAYFLNAAALYSEAEPIMREVLEMVEQRLGADHKDVAPHLNNLALLLKARGRLRDAVPMMERALNIAERYYGRAHPNVATALNNLAQLVGEKGDPAEAERMMRRALEIDEAEYGPEHAKVATRLSNLAQYLPARGSKEAEQMMRRALEIDNKRLGKDHPVVAIRLNNLAQFLLATGRLGEAEPMMHEALRIDERSLGKAHPTVAIRLGNLAQLLQAKGHFDEAEILMKRALEIDKLCLGPDHSDVAADLAALGRLYQAGNRLTEAEANLRSAIQIIERSSTRNYHRLLAILDQLAQVLYEADRSEEAANLTNRAMQIAQERFGPEHPNTAERMDTRARLLHACGELEEAQTLMRRALKIAEAQVPPQPIVIASRLRNLALLLHDDGQLPEAASLFRRALEMSKEIYGLEDPEVATCLGDLARLLHDFSGGELAEAEHLLRRAVTINERRYPIDHPAMVADLKSMARLLKKTGRLAEAKILMRQALIIDIDRYGKASRIVSDDIDWIVQLGRSEREDLHSELSGDKKFPFFHPAEHILQK